MAMDIAAVIIIVAMAVWGYRSGFVRSVFSFGYFVISAIVAAIAYPIVTTSLLNTSFAGVVRDKIAEHLSKSGTGSEMLQSLPGFLSDPVNRGISSATDAVATSITQTVINLVSIILVFILVRFGLKIIVKIFNVVASMPVISFFNKTGGFLIGIVNGFIIIYLLLAIATLFVTSPIVKQIADSQFAGYLYENNLLLKLIFR